MIDNIYLDREKLEQAERLDAREALEHLKQSEVIRMVLDGKFTPHELDSAYRNMKKEIVKLQNENYANKAEIMRLRRFTELLTMKEADT